MRDAGIGSWPARRRRRAPDAIALVHGEDRLTYAQLDNRSRALALALRTTGIGPGDRVAYLGPNHPAFAETLFATHRLGAIFVPLNARLAGPEIAYMLADSGSEVVVVAPSCEAALAAADYGGRTIHLASDYETLLASAPSDSLDEAVAVDEPALILYTSGTTGRPKGAVLTHANVLANCFNMLVDEDLRHDEVSLVAAPLFHVAALNQLFLPTLVKGGTCVIMPGWDVDACLDLIEKHRVTWLFGVTAMFAGLAASPRFAAADLSSVRRVFSGGAPVPLPLIETYQRRGVVFCQGYGMTETAPGATFLGPEVSLSKAGTAGTACFLTDVHVVRPDGTETDPGEPGEVLVQGPNVTPGYWNRPEATGESLRDGWFHTGDVAVRDADGYVRIVDRVKDMFISGGENVYPAEVEAAAFAFEGVAECAVIGIPDERWGEVGRAYVVTASGASLDVEELRAFLLTRLAKYKVPAEIRVVPALPRTGSGKVAKARLRQA